VNLTLDFNCLHCAYRRNRRIVFERVTKTYYICTIKRLQYSLYRYVFQQLLEARGALIHGVLIGGGRNGLVYSQACMTL